MTRIALALAAAFAILGASELRGQDQGAAAAPVSTEPASTAPASGETRTADELIDAAREALRPAGVRRPAVVAEPGTIVVTAQTPDPPSNMYPDDPRSADSGRPRAPDVSGLPPCAPVCIGIGEDPVAPLLIDLKAIPEAPPGSDAARYAEEP